MRNLTIALKILGFAFIIAISLVVSEIFFQIHLNGARHIKITENNPIVLAFEYPMSIFTSLFSIYLLIDFLKKTFKRRSR